MEVAPERLTNFNRTQNELELMVTFSVAVAGKTARIMARQIAAFFGNEANPFDYLEMLYTTGLLRQCLEKYRIGMYTKMTKFVESLIAAGPLNLKTISVEDLYKLHGIGYKTAKMIVLHSQPNKRMAVIDTHILKFMRDVMHIQGLPKSSPQSKNRYDILEEELLAWVDNRIKYEPHVCVFKGDKEIGCITLKRRPDGQPDYAAFDLDVWNLYAGNNAP